ncbi:MAG: hypothetical protein NT165_01975 [Candidatus Falkowbacteria bacterium]|nr:hypothetical protein [Candidatus Falkowbacteria bacterium]
MKKFQIFCILFVLVFTSSCSHHEESLSERRAKRFITFEFSDGKMATLSGYSLLDDIDEDPFVVQEIVYVELNDSTLAPGALRHLRDVVEKTDEKGNRQLEALTRCCGSYPAKLILATVKKIEQK